MDAACPQCGQPATVFEGPPSHKTGTVFCDNCHARIPLPVSAPAAEEEQPASADETAAAEEAEGESAEQDDPSPRGRRRHN